MHSSDQKWHKTDKNVQLQINAALLIILFIKEWILKHQINKLQRFQKDNEPLKTEVMMQKFQLCHHKNKFCLLYIVNWNGCLSWCVAICAALTTCSILNSLPIVIISLLASSAQTALKCEHLCIRSCWVCLSCCCKCLHRGFYFTIR